MPRLWPKKASRGPETDSSTWWVGPWGPQMGPAECQAGGCPPGSGPPARWCSWRWWPSTALTPAFRTSWGTTRRQKIFYSRLGPIEGWDARPNTPEPEQWSGLAAWSPAVPLRFRSSAEDRLVRGVPLDPAGRARGENGWCACRGESEGRMEIPRVSTEYRRTLGSLRQADK